MGENSIVRVFAPATVSNVGSGYDIMGFAFDGPGDIIEVGLNDSGSITLDNISGTDLPLDKTNVVYPAIEKMSREYNKNIGIHLNFLKKINPGSGIGSSAASSVGAVFALNHLLADPFSKLQLIEFALEGEKLVSGEAHADNVAPCMMGGFTLIRSYDPLDIIEIPFPKELICTVVHPDIVIKTADSRRILKSEIPIKDAVTQTGNAAALISGLFKNDLELIGRSVRDVIAEPYRCKLIPFYNDANQAAMDSGALAFNISGSGPSLFAFSTSRKTAQNIGEKISSLFSSGKIESKIYISPISGNGVRIIP